MAVAAGTGPLPEVRSTWIATAGSGAPPSVAIRPDAPNVEEPPVNSLLTSARTSTADGVNPIPAFAAEALYDPPTWNPTCRQPPLASVTTDGGTATSSRPATRRNEICTPGMPGGLPAPRITSATRTTPLAAKVATVPSKRRDAWVAVSVARAGEKVTPADDATAT